MNGNIPRDHISNLQFERKPNKITEIKNGFKESLGRISEYPDLLKHTFFVNIRNLSLRLREDQLEYYYDRKMLHSTSRMNEILQVFSGYYPDDVSRETATTDPSRYVQTLQELEKGAPKLYGRFLQLEENYSKYNSELTNIRDLKRVKEEVNNVRKKTLNVEIELALQNEKIPPKMPKIISEKNKPLEIITPFEVRKGLLKYKEILEAEQKKLYKKSKPLQDIIDRMQKQKAEENSNQDKQENETLNNKLLQENKDLLEEQIMKQRINEENARAEFIRRKTHEEEINKENQRIKNEQDKLIKEQRELKILVEEQKELIMNFKSKIHLNEQEENARQRKIKDLQNHIDQQNAKLSILNAQLQELDQKNILNESNSQKLKSDIEELEKKISNDNVVVTTATDITDNQPSTFEEGQIREIE